MNTSDLCRDCGALSGYSHRPGCTLADKLQLHDALLGGPGLSGYAYNAALYCKDCGQALTRKVFEDYPDGIPYPDALDSDTVPQPDFFGESDTPQHCDECGEYLYGGKSMAAFIEEHRTELYNAVWQVVPNKQLDDDDIEQWIANDEALYNWAREEGVNV